MLRKEFITKWNQSYRNGNPDVSDERFDAELALLKKEIPAKEFKLFSESLFEEGGELTHEFVMGSLNKIRYGENELNKWTNSAKIRKLFVSAKIDGMSFVATYDRGQLKTVATRGNGKKGVDITHKVAGVVLPREIDSVNYTVIRGELTLTADSHIKLGFKNRRNGTVGLIGRSDVDKEKLAHVNAYCYEVMNATCGIADQFTWMKNMGFNVPKNEIVISYELEEYLKNLLQNYKNQCEYDIDGLVISSPNWTNEALLHPKNKAAFKVNSEGYTTAVVGIEWNLSKTGALKPVLLLEPTEIDGTTVQRANGCNAQMMKDKGTGIGSEVLIIKSGDIIPKVIHVVTESKPELPVNCPSCGEKLIWKGVDLFCAHDCGEAAVKKVSSFLRDCGVENITEKSLIKWDINNFNDLLAFDPDTNSKAQDKFAESLSKNIFTKSEIELFSNMYFDGAGTKTILKAIEFYGFATLNQIMVNNECVETFPEGIGEKTIEKMRSDYRRNLKVLAAIVSDCRYNFTQKKETKIMSKDGNLTGKSFLFTGTLSAPRKTFEAKVLAGGGTLSSSVSKNLSFLVVGEDAGSKLAKAQKLGVICLTEAEFEAMI